MKKREWEEQFPSVHRKTKLETARVREKKQADTYQSRIISRLVPNYVRFPGRTEKGKMSAKGKEEKTYPTFHGTA